jgi:hypothetical protein
MSAVVAPSAVSELSPVRLLVRRVAVVGCAGAVAGVVVAFPLGRLAMRLLAAANPGATGMSTDDGFAVGTVSLDGSAQLLLSAIQISMLGAALYLLLRPLLLGPSWCRTATLSVGVATCFAALLADPAGFDFTILDPPWLPILLFWLLPLVHTAVFATLAEHWLREDSWFMRASDPAVSWTLFVWLLSGIGLVMVLPLFLVAALVVFTLGRRPAPRAAGEVGRWTARALLVAVFFLGLVGLVQDTQQLV